VNRYGDPAARAGQAEEGGNAVPQPPPPAADEYLVLKVRPGTLPPEVIGTEVPVVEADEAELPDLLDLFGVNHLANIAGALDRTVKLSERSDICCPAHGFTLKPDACRSCAFLCGDVQPEPHPPA
jgi:hypothetical protein